MSHVVTSAERCLSDQNSQEWNLMLRSGAAIGCHYVMDEIHSASSIFSFSSHSLSVAAFHTTQRMREERKLSSLRYDRRNDLRVPRSNRRGATTCAKSALFYHIRIWAARMFKDVCVCRPILCDSKFLILFSLDSWPTSEK